LRASPLAGIEVPGLPERIVSTMFADDTTVFLRSTDSYNLMNDILDKWCEGSRAKFNGPKTVIIPIGPTSSRDRLRKERSMVDGGPPLPPEVKILEEGEGTRVLGAWIGPAYDDCGPWARVTETIKSNLERWERRNPTLKGRQVIVNMELGGRTQYLARVQGMPSAVEAHLEKLGSRFLWGGAK
ncbi:hypothetical protein C2E23DRAFT_690728, partial [Lenzites betulinus]